MRKAFLVKGDVQRAMVRSVIRDTAKKHHLSGFTKNLGNYDEDVFVFCEGKEADVGAFERALRKQKEEDGKLVAKERELRGKIGGLDGKLDDMLLSDNVDSAQETMLLLKRKKSLLRDLKDCGLRHRTYRIDEIISLDVIGDYKADIDGVDYGGNFIIVRDKDEVGERLDEGIGALSALARGTSELHYDIIDTDFTIIDVKYGTLSKSIEEGFRNFPKAFAVAFEETLEKKYGMKPQTSAARKK